MATFPDSFDRADASTLGSVVWREYTNGWRIVSNSAAPDLANAVNCAQMVAKVDSGNHHAQIEIGPGFGGSLVGPTVFMPEVFRDNLGTGSFYLLALNGDDGRTLTIRRKAPRTSEFTTLASATLPADARLPGSRLDLTARYDEVTGFTHLIGKVNGIQRVSVSDGSGVVPSTNRRVGMYAAGGSANLLRVASFLAGDELVTEPPVLVPAMPTGLVATGDQPNTIRLDWVPSPGATSYEVYVVADGTFIVDQDADGENTGEGQAPTTTVTLVNGTKIGTVTAPQFVHVNLTSNGVYNYAVRALNSAGASALSTTVTEVASPPDTTPPVAGEAWIPSEPWIGAQSWPQYAPHDWEDALSWVDTDPWADAEAPVYTPWYLWNGTGKVPAELVGVWNGDTVVPVKKAYPYSPPNEPDVIAPLVSFTVARTDQTVTLTFTTAEQSAPVAGHGVDWGDGSAVEFVTAGTATHTYEDVPADGRTVVLTVEAVATDNGRATDAQILFIPGEQRRAATHPFSATSPWNVSLGSGATYEIATAPKTANLTSGTSAALIEATSGSVPVWVAREVDPAATFTADIGSVSHRTPVIAAAQGGRIAVLDGENGHEYRGAVKMSSAVWTADRGAIVDILGTGIGNGVRDSRFSLFAGLIRRHEIEQGDIPHALVLGLTGAQLKAGYVWPAADEGSGYTGQVPMGSMVAIPPSVDLFALGLTSSEGLALAIALQDYGAYVGDRTDGGATLFATPDCNDLSGLIRLRADWPKLWKQLRVVTNSSESEVGGGGIRRRPPALNAVPDYVIGTEPPVVVPPVVAFTTSQTGSTVTATITTSAGSGAVTGHAISWGDGQTTNLTEPTRTAQRTYSPPSGGQTYTITVTATAADGGTASSTRTVTIASPVTAPTVSFTLTRSAQTVTMDASASTAGSGALLRFLIDWGDGSAVQTINEPTRTAQRTYSPPAGGQTYTVRVTAVAADGGQALATRTVTVPSVSVVTNPTASFTLSASAQTVTMNAAGTTAGSAPIARHEITWGDGSAVQTITEPTRSTTHLYSPPTSGQTYTVQVRAVATDGGSSTATRTINVAGVQEPDPDPEPSADNQPAATGAPTGSATEMYAGSINRTSTSTYEFVVGAKTTGVSGGAKLAVATNATMTGAVVTKAAAATPDTLGMVKCAIGGLAANTTYYWCLQLGNGLFKTTIGKIRTGPPATGGSFNFSFASCEGGPGRSMVWQRCIAPGRDARFFFHLGDFKYMDNTVQSETPYHSRYAEMWNQANGKNYLLNGGFHYTWSDHDFGPNNGVGMPPDPGAALKPYAQASYRRRMPVRTYPDGGTGLSGGIQHTFVYGRVRFFLLDCRSYKTRNTSNYTDPTKRYLGDLQRAWVESVLKSTPERVIFFAQDTPWQNGTAKEDAWQGYEWERTEFANMLKAIPGKNYFILSGDQHCLGADDGANGKGIPAFSAASIHGGTSWKVTDMTWGGVRQFYPPLNSTKVTGEQRHGHVEVIDTGGSTITIRFTGYDNTNTARINVSKTVTVA